MDFDFQANWSRMATPPPSGHRCIVTDGDVIVLATYIKDSDGHAWIFSGINEADSKSFKVQGWMPLPHHIKKLIEINEKPVETNLGENKERS
jgi:hypothetical protein